MATNRNFGKLVDGEVKYAPTNLMVNGVLYAAPTAEQYLDAGWKAVDMARPPEKEGFTPRAVGWIELEYDIACKWEYELLPAPVPVYSVEDVIYGLIQRGKLQAVKAVLGDLYDLITMRETVSADSEILVAEFPRIKAALVADGILTEDEIAAILKDAEV